MTHDAIDDLVRLLARLPGLGPRSARRVVLHLLKRRENLMPPLLQALQSVNETVKVCSVCANMDVADPCAVCTAPKRDRKMICVVENVDDLWALERTNVWNGLYHVLGGTLSALDGVGPEDLRIPALVERARAADCAEVVLALGVTVEGQATVHYIADRLHSINVVVSVLAHGVPVGGELDYLDEGTLSMALSARHPFA